MICEHNELISKIIFNPIKQILKNEQNTRNLLKLLSCFFPFLNSDKHQSIDY